MGMLAMGEIYDPNPSVRLQIRFDVMLIPYFEECVEYVSDWISVETILLQ